MKWNCSDTSGRNTLLNYSNDAVDRWGRNTLLDYNDNTVHRSGRFTLPDWINDTVDLACEIISFEDTVNVSFSFA